MSWSCKECLQGVVLKLKATSLPKLTLELVSDSTFMPVINGPGAYSGRGSVKARALIDDITLQ